MGDTSLDGVATSGVGAGETGMSQRAQGGILHQAPVVNDLLSGRTVGRRNRFLKLVYCRLIMGRGFG
jgi:hypothetical protein